MFHVLFKAIDPMTLESHSHEIRFGCSEILHYASKWTERVRAMWIANEYKLVALPD